MRNPQITELYQVTNVRVYGTRRVTCCFVYLFIIYPRVLYQLSVHGFADRRVVFPPASNRQQRSAVYLGPEVGHGVEAGGNTGAKHGQPCIDVARALEIRRWTNYLPLKG